MTHLQRVGGEQGPEERKFRLWLATAMAEGLTGVHATWAPEAEGLNREERFACLNRMNEAPKEPWPVDL